MNRIPYRAAAVGLMAVLSVCRRGSAVPVPALRLGRDRGDADPYVVVGVVLILASVVLVIAQVVMERAFLTTMTGS